MEYLSEFDIRAKILTKTGLVHNNYVPYRHISLDELMFNAKVAFGIISGCCNIRAIELNSLTIGDKSICAYIDRIQPSSMKCEGVDCMFHNDIGIKIRHPEIKKGDMIKYLSNYSKSARK